MTDDLVKFLRTSTSSAYNKVAADLIEQLAATCEELRLGLDNERQYQVSMEYLYALDEEVISDLKKHIEQLDAKLTECEARLSKVVEALQWYADFGNYLSNRGGYAPIDLDKGGKAEDTLAELEK